LLSHPRTDRLDGQWYQAVDARTIPGCRQQPRVPLAVAGGGPRALAVAAAHAQVWVTLGDPRRAAELDDAACLQVARTQRDGLERACEAIDRDPATLDLLYMQGATNEPWLESVETFAELAGRYHDLGFTDLALHWPRTSPPYVADPDVFRAILASVAPD